MRLPAAVLWLLWPLSLVYGAAARLRVWCYRWGFFRAHRLNGLVISVGNLTVGGTGKTPMVAWLCERLLAEGRTPGILSRGYRGAGCQIRRSLRTPADAAPEKIAHRPRGADEVRLYRIRFGEKVQVAVNRDRVSVGRDLESQGIDVFVLDDGYQHLRLARDVDIVLVDAADPFGGGFLLPAGLLREPVSALGRADIVVVTRSGSAPVIEATVRRYTKAPIFYARTELERVCSVTEDLSRGEPLMAVRLLSPQAQVRNLEPAEWKGKKWYAFCGIGNPGAFFDDLIRWGFTVTGRGMFRDHHMYRRKDADAILSRARAAGADGVVCTEKDYQNLSLAHFTPALVVYCQMRLEVLGGDAFWQSVRHLAAEHHAHAGAAE